jgi:peptidoglycan pentaglycine glycine transferase (the first glycine)
LARSAVALGASGSEAWRLRPVAAEERSVYDELVEGHSRGHPLQLWSWGEVKQRDGWTPLRFVLECEGSVAGAVSVVERRLPGGAAFWWAHRGPVVEPQGRAAPALFANLRRAAAARGAVGVRLDPEWSEADAARLVGPGVARVPVRQAWYGGAMQPVRVWRISLGGGEGAVWQRFEARTRRDVRLAERRGVTVRVGRHEDLAAFYALEHAIARRKHFAVRSFEFFERLWQAWNLEGRGELLVAEDGGGRVVGGVWWLRCGHGAWGQFAATDPSARHLLPAVALYWAGIRHAIERDCAFFDFGGIGHRADADDGLRAFKKGFGPGDTRFVGEIDLVARPAAYLAFRVAEDLRWAWYGQPGERLRRPWTLVRPASAHEEPRP